jgi:hypothetical protein
MVAFAMHLLRTVPGLKHVAVHPDGEHGKRFDFRGWLAKRGFMLTEPTGTTPYGAGTLRILAVSSLSVQRLVGAMWWPTSAT